MTAAHHAAWHLHNPAPGKVDHRLHHQHRCDSLMLPSTVLRSNCIARDRATFVSARVCIRHPNGNVVRHQGDGYWLCR